MAKVNLSRPTREPTDTDEEPCVKKPCTRSAETPVEQQQRRDLAPDALVPSAQVTQDVFVRTTVSNSGHHSILCTMTLLIYDLLKLTNACPENAVKRMLVSQHKKSWGKLEN